MTRYYPPGVRLLQVYALQARWFATWLLLALSLSSCTTTNTLPLPSGGRDAVQRTKADADVKPAASAAAEVKERPASGVKGGEALEIRFADPADPQHPAKPVDEVLPPLDRKNSVYFTLGSYGLDSDAKAVIKRHAEKLNGDARLSVTLIGYTDDLGSREYNNALCLKRAHAVEQALQSLGVSEKQLRISNRYGYEKSLDKPCRTDVCRKRLRKVELRYKK